MCACLGLAALSLLRPSAPTTDPWGWIVWGREVLHLDLNTSVGTPAWKPLPVLFTTPLALFGGAAPLLWLVVARAAGLIALVFAFRLGRRAGGPVAGVLAAAFLGLSSSWLRALEHGYTEPMMVALALAAVERHVDGRRLQALALGALVALGRPEAFAFVALYAIFAWRALLDRRRAIVGLVAVVPVLWLGGDWWGAGNPLHARHVAGEAANSFTATDVLSSLASLAGAALLAPALLAWARRPRDVLVASLAWGALAWVALLWVLAQTGYPGSERFLVLPAAAVCVLAGVGVGELGSLWRSHPRLRPALVAAVALLVVLYAPAQLSPLPRAVQVAERLARSQHALRALVGPRPGDDRRCETALLPTSLDWNAGAVAWDRDIPLRSVRSAFTGRQALESDRPLVDVLVGRGPSVYGLDASPRAGGELYLRHRGGPVDPRVPPGFPLQARVEARGGRWARVAVCPRRTAATRVARAGA